MALYHSRIWTNRYCSPIHYLVKCCQIAAIVAIEHSRIWSIHYFPQCVIDNIGYIIRSVMKCVSVIIPKTSSHIVFVEYWLMLEFPTEFGALFHMLSGKYSVEYRSQACLIMWKLCCNLMSIVLWLEYNSKILRKICCSAFLNSMDWSVLIGFFMVLRS
jgi:hypothetical protein